MAKTVKGQVGGRVVDYSKMPKGMRRVDPEYDVATFKEGPIARWMSRRR